MQGRHRGRPWRRPRGVAAEGTKIWGRARKEGEKTFWGEDIAPKMNVLNKRLIAPALFLFTRAPLYFFYVSLSAPCIGAYFFVVAISSTEL
jgi:hypothetical protein